MLAATLVTQYGFNEGQGAVAHDTSNSGNNDDGTLSDGVSWTAGHTGQAGDFALSFNGTSGKVTALKDLNQWLGNTASLTAWVRTTQVGNNTYWQAPGITGVEQSGGQDDAFWGWIDAAGRVGVQAGDGPSPQSYAPVNDGQWHHLALTRDAASGEVRTYVDGTLVNANPAAAAGVKHTPFHDIGAVGLANSSGVPTGTNTYFAGALDDVRIYSGVLTAQQIAQEAAASPATQPPVTNGLFATYYDQRNFTGTSFAATFAGNVVTRVDPVVNFDWGNGSPDASLPADNFSAVWEGQIQADAAGTYTFYTQTDDGALLTVDGQVVIDDTASPSHAMSTERSGTIALAGNQRHTIRLSYFEGTNGAGARLLWSGPGVAKQVVPQDHLFPTLPAAPAAPSNLTVAPQGAGLTLTWTDNATNESGYRIERAADPAGPFTLLDTVRPATTYTDATVTPLTTYYYRVSATNLGGTSGPSNVASGTAAGVAPGGGLSAFYFPTRDYSGVPAVTRVDPNVDYNYGNGAPAGLPASFPTDNFSVVWRGEVQADVTGTYTFTTETDDGVDLVVNGQRLVHDAGLHAPLRTAATIDLVAGQRYPVVMKYFDAVGGATARLLWTLPNAPAGTAPQVVPADHLFTAARGVRATYYNHGSGPFFTGPAIPMAVPAGTDVNFGNGSPGQGINADNFSGIFEGMLTAPETGTYTFHTASDDGIALQVIDPDTGSLLVARNNIWAQRGVPATGFSDLAGSAALQAGKRYLIRWLYTEGAGGAGYRVGWGTPSDPTPRAIPAAVLTPLDAATPVSHGPTFGVRATFYNERFFTGQSFDLQPFDAEQDFGTLGPPGLTADPGNANPNDTFSGLFDGYLKVEASGRYTFYTASDDGIALRVTDVQTAQDLVNYDNLLAARGVPATGFSDTAGAADLVAGRLYQVQWKYSENQFGAGYRVGWSGPGVPQQVIPARLLTPGANDAPVAVDDTFATPAGTPLLLAPTALTGNDRDPDNTPAQLSVASVSNATGGTVELLTTGPDAGKIRFTPAAGFSGTAGFDYAVSDGALTATGHVTVLALNVPPATPDSLRAAARADGVHLAFRDASADETGFVVERAAVAGGRQDPFAQVGQPIAPAAGVGGTVYFTDSSAEATTPNATYVYRVRAVNANGMSDPSAATPLVATGPRGGTGAQVSWYNDQNFGGTPIAFPPAPAAQIFGDGSPQPDPAKPNYGRVDHFSGAFQADLLAEFSEAYTFYTASDDGIRLRLTDPATNQVLFDSNHLDALRAMPAADQPAFTPVFSEQAGVATLQAGKRYRVEWWFNDNDHAAGYRVGWSSPSVPQEVIPTDLLSPPPVGPPAAPTGLSVFQTVGNDQVGLTWMGVAGATGYEVQRSGDNSNFGTIGTVAAGVTSYTDVASAANPLAANAIYYYRVRALGAAGASPYGQSAVTVTAVGGFGLAVNGSAAVLENDPATTADNVLRLTDHANGQLGSVFTANARPVVQQDKGPGGGRGFTAGFDFRIPQATNPPADGIAFVIQRDGNAALGAGGGGLGYQGMPDSLAVKFDLYPPGGCTTGLYVNGAMDDGGKTAADGVPNFANGDTYRVTLAYDAAAGTLTETIADLAAAAGTPAAAPVIFTYTTATAAGGSLPLNGLALLGGESAFVGLTAATGGLNAEQQVLRFSFDGDDFALSTKQPGPVIAAAPGTSFAYNPATQQLAVSSGSLTIQSDPTAPDVPVAVAATGATSKVFIADTQQVASLALDAGATATVVAAGPAPGAGTSRAASPAGTVASGAHRSAAPAASPAPRVLVLDSLSINAAAGSSLDLADNDLVVHNGNLANIQALISSGYNKHNWNGSGIISSAAAGKTSVALGYALNDGSVIKAKATFGPSDEPVGPSDVLVKYTWEGDSNLDGQVSFDDYFYIDSKYPKPSGSTWVTGDFDYNGQTSFDDYFYIDSNYPRNSVL